MARRRPPTQTSKSKIPLINPYRPALTPQINATLEYLDELVAGGTPSSGGGGSVDLSNYPTKAEVNTLLSNSNIAVDTKISTAISDYVKKTDVYTRAQVDASISSSITSNNAIVNSKITSAVATAVGNIDLSGYYTKGQVDTAITTAVNAIDYSPYYTKAQVDSAILTAMNSVDLSNYYSKGQVDSAISTAVNAIDYSNYYTKTQVDTNMATAISNIDLSSYYTKGQMDAKFLQLESELTTKQDVLTLKTINGESILGSGDITVEGSSVSPSASLINDNAVSTTKTYSSKKIEALTNSASKIGDMFIPVGETVKAVSDKVVPYGYAFADGKELPIGTYPDYEAWLVATYGKVNQFGGDGTSTYKLPDIGIKVDIIPTAMTSNSSNGMVASSSSSYDGNYLAWEAFDSNVSDHTREWASVNNATNPHWLAIDYGDVYEVTGFRIYQRVNKDGHETKQVRFETSNNGTTWTTIKDFTTPGAHWGNVSYLDFELDAPVKARYFRLSNLNSGSGWTNIQEWQNYVKFPEYLVKVIETGTLAGTAITVNSGSQHSHLNKSTLDYLGENGAGELTYRGAPVGRDASLVPKAVSGIVVEDVAKDGKLAVYRSGYTIHVDVFNLTPTSTGTSLKLASNLPKPLVGRTVANLVSTNTGTGSTLHTATPSHLYVSAQGVLLVHVHSTSPSIYGQLTYLTNE